MTVGKKMWQIRKAAKKTQIEVAKQAGISVNSLRLYEADKRQPNLETLQKISTALCVNVSEFLPDESKEKLYARDEMLIARTDDLIAQLESTRRLPILELYSQLNKAGQDEAIIRLYEMTQLEKYKRKTENGQDGI